MENTNSNSSYRRHDLIPYEKSAIQILKEKKKSRPFCRFEKRNNPLPPPPLLEVDTKEKQAFEEDVISETSSDISSVASVQSISGDCSVATMNGSVKNAMFYRIIAV